MIDSYINIYIKINNKFSYKFLICVDSLENFIYGN